MSAPVSVQYLAKKKLADDQINETRAYLQAIFDNSLDAIVANNDEGRYIDANPAACKLLGYTRDELLELSFLDMTEPSLRQTGEAMWEQFLATGSISGEFSLLRKDGTAIQLEFRAVANILPGVHVSSSRDITERKRAEEAQRAAEKKYRDIFDNAPGGIFQTTAEGRFVAANPALAHMFGFDSPEELIRERADISNQHYVDPDRREEFKRRLAAEGVVHNFENECYRKDGTTIWVSETVRAVRDNDGTLLYYEGTTQDITERKRVAQAQRESQQQYETLVQSIDGIVWEADPKTFTFTFVSKQAERILGYPLAEWLNEPSFWPDHMHPEDRDWAVDFCVESTGRGCDHQFEYRMIAADGRVVWLRDIVTVCVAEDQSVLLRGLMVDVTDRKLTEQKLRQREHQLAEAQRIAHIGNWISEINSETEVWSQELYRIYGLTPGLVAPTYKAFIQLVHPEDRVRLREVDERCSITREPIDLHVRITRPDGEERILHCHSCMFYDDDGTPIKRFGTAQDVTEHWRAQQALQEAERKYRDIFENAAEGIFQTTPEGKFISANPALVQMFGFSSAEELIRERADISNQHYVDPKRREEFKRKMDEEGGVKGFELEAFRKDGSTIWLSENCRAVRDAGGNVLYYEGTAWDITERRQSDHSLRLFRSLIDGSADAIEVVDPNTLRFLDCNSSAHQHLGYSREEFLSLSVYDIDPLIDESMNKRLVEEMDRAGFMLFESVHRRKDGSTFPVEINLKTINLERDFRLAVVRDITERKVAEKSLHTAEQKYRDIFEQAVEGIFQTTPEGRFVVANPAFARMFGFDSPEELIRERSDISMQHYVDPKRRDEFTRQLAAEGIVHDFEYEGYRKDGSRIWVSETVRAVRDSDGSLLYYEGTSQDITDRKRAEEALRESEERYRELFENAKDATYVHDLNGRYTSVNRAAEKLAGLSREEIIGRRFSDFIPPDQFEVASDQLCKKLAQEGNTTYETEVLTHDGRRVPVEVSSHLIYENGIGVGVQGTARDITERKRAEERLREYEKVVEGLEEMIVVVDRDFRYLLANQSFLKYRGKTRDQVLGRLVSEVVGTDLFEGVIKKGLEQSFRGQLVTYEVKTTFPNLGERDMLVSVIPIEGPTGIDRAACVITDITESKRAEATLRNYSRLLVEAQEAERQHIARELHDQIGQMLTTIKFNLQTLGGFKEIDKAKAVIDQGVGLIDTALGQVRNLSFELRPSLLDNVGLVAALRWYSDQFAQRTGIATKWHSNVPEGSTRFRQELETACFRIVQEALTNVVRHAEARHVVIDLNIVDEQTVLTIKDDGVGITRPAQQNNSPSNIHLGLIGMRERALALGGTIEIDSTPNQGTQIRVSFPTEAAD